MRWGFRMHIKILIVDDHEVVRQGLRTILKARQDWEIVGEAENGQEAVRAVMENKPDVVIRSEERRVGKECRCRGGPEECKGRRVARDVLRVAGSARE